MSKSELIKTCAITNTGRAGTVLSTGQKLPG